MMVDYEPVYNEGYIEQFRKFESLWSKNYEVIKQRQEEWKKICRHSLNNPAGESAVDKYFIGRYYVYGEQPPSQISTPLETINFKPMFRFVYTPFQNAVQVQDMWHTMGQGGKRVHETLYHYAGGYLYALDDCESRVKFLVEALYNEKYFNLTRIIRNKAHPASVVPKTFANAFERESDTYLNTEWGETWRAYCHTPYLVNYYRLCLNHMSENNEASGEYLPAMIKRLKKVQDEKFGDSRDLLRDQLLNLIHSEDAMERLKKAWG